MAKILMEGKRTVDDERLLLGLTTPVLPEKDGKKLLAAIVNIVCVASTMSDVFIQPNDADPEVCHH